MSNKKSAVILFFMLSCFLCGALVFLNGFFPDAYIASDDVNEQAFSFMRPTNVNGIKIYPPKAKYNQIILMIIDAFRFDFVSPTDSMPFVNMNKCGFVKLRVAIPTVTMPRIKSLMTGTISNFIDIIRNLGETEELTDSLLHVLQSHKKIINFIGDHTWTKLFPNEFTRKRPNTDSFFVNDFYEGDRQINETLRTEIEEMDWSLLILHFLGLDHIGHVEGSKSDKIATKLIEMDGIVKEICTHKKFEKRLLLLTGDHGMRNGGGHGGSTEEELTVPLLSFNDACGNTKSEKVKEYSQIDLATTLAMLLSVEIPKPSIGVIIPELLDNFLPEELLYAYLYNAHHLMEKAYAKYGEKFVKDIGYARWFKDAQIAHHDFIQSREKNIPGSFYYEQAIQNYARVSDELSLRMSESLVNFDYGLIGIGVFLTSTVTIYTILFMLFTAKQKVFQQNKSVLIFSAVLWLLSLVIAIVINVSSTELELIRVNNFKRNFLITIILTVAVYISFGILRQLQKLLLPLPSASKVNPVWSFPKHMVIAYLMTVILLGSSSFIELEHLTWHYLGVSCIFLLLLNVMRQNVRKRFESFEIVGSHLQTFVKIVKTEFVNGIFLFVLLRCLTDWNTPINQRYGTWQHFFKEISISLLFVASLIWLLLQLKNLTTKRQFIFSISSLVSVFFFRAFQGKLYFLPVLEVGSFLALCSFWLFTLITFWMDYKKTLAQNGSHVLCILQRLFVGSLSLAALLHQPRNVIMLPSLLHILDQIYKFCDNLQLAHNIRAPYKQRYILAYKTFLTLFAANMFFFYQGNSNSLATIDLNPGYIGQSTYEPVVVGVLVTLNTYCAPIHSFFYFVFHLLNETQSGTNEKPTLERPATLKKGSLPSFPLIENENLQLVTSLYTTLTILPVAVYLGLMILFRYHLFIYSVFAPKVFYECFRVLVFFIKYCVLYLILLIFN